MDHARAIARLDFEVKGGRLSARRQGPQDAPRLLFAHANGFNARTYDRVLAPLAPHFDVVAVDMRGCGSSDAPADPARLVSWETFADDLGAVADQLSGAPLLLAGHSFGATASILMLARRPHAALGVIAIEPVLLPPSFLATGFLPFAGLMRRYNPMVQGALRRRAGFPSREAAIDNYRQKPTFASWSDGILEDYVEGGTRETPDGVTLACAPAWEAAVFGSHRHRTWRAVRRLGDRLDVLKARRGSTVRRPDLVVAASARLETSEAGGHLLPMEAPEIASAWLLERARARFDRI